MNKNLKIILILLIIIIIFGILWKDFYNNHVIRRQFGILRKSEIEPFKVVEKINRNQKTCNCYTGRIVTSLFGNFSDPNMRKKYVKPLLNNVKKKIPIDKWRYRIYVSPNIPDELIKEFVDANCEVYIMNRNSRGVELASARLLPLKSTKPFISIDADNRIERYNWSRIKKWLKSSYPFYIPHNQIFVPIAAGDFGHKGTPVKNIKQLLEKYDFQKYGDDEAFLRREIYPIAQQIGYSPRTIHPYYMAQLLYISFSLISIPVIILLL